MLGSTRALTMKPDAKPLRGLLGEPSPHKLKRSISLFPTASTIALSYLNRDRFASQFPNLKKVLRFCPRTKNDRPENRPVVFYCHALPKAAGDYIPRKLWQ